ncbi:MAG: protein kinase domain-containing protein, partial [Chitinophagales bacterium]
MKAITQNNTSITLSDQNEIHRGGEGQILLIPELRHQVAKIYHNPNATITLQQIQALKVLDKQYFVKPLQVIQDASTSTIIGFTMDYLGKDFFPLASLFSAPFCQRKQINEAAKWKIAHQIQAAITQAHQHQIVIGDLSGLNILVNDKGVVKFIDVDAYQTPIQPHSAVLYDEIRDHYYQGKVSQDSDHFAFAVILFQLLAYIHPFKGIHSTYKTLADRMIHQIPVFAKDARLKTPKCYRPIANPILQQQFEAIFMNGHRAPLQLSKTTPTIQQILP